jgi:predicted nucleic acid-binding protein
MTTGHNWVVLDTNVWIFGFRNQPEHPACSQVLRRLNRLYVKVPRQVLLELRANLSEKEMSELFRLLGHYPDRIDIRWDKAEMELVRKYQKLGCKLGDAVIAAHVEEMNVRILISENRDFLEEIKGLPFRVLNAEDLLRELESIK